MFRRKIRDAEEARACLATVEARGEPRAAWARANGIDARSLNAWRLNLERNTRRTGELRLVELVPTSPPAQPSSPARYQVHVGGFTVEVDDRFDDGVLARLLGVVTGC